jgi:hypothetical protein
VEIVINVEGKPDLTAVVGGEIRFFNHDTDEYEMRDRTLGDMIAEKIADGILKEMDREWRQDLFTRVREERKNLIHERLEPILDEAMKAPIKRTNEYGEPMIGKELTMRELIVDEAHKIITSKPIRSGYGGSETILQKTIREEIKQAFAAELSAELQAAKKAMVAAVQEKAVEYMTEAVLRKKTGV